METRFPIEVASVLLPSEILPEAVISDVGMLKARGVIYHIDDYNRKSPRIQAVCKCGNIVHIYVSSWLKKDYASCGKC